MSWIQTNSGIRFEILNPTVDMINIEDIATSLSKQCRYNGHCENFYSVARHSLVMSKMAPPHLKLVSLLHDATEAYIGDMVKPLKNLIPEFEVIEDKIWLVIADKFNLPMELPREVKDLDLRMLATEKLYIMKEHPDKWPSFDTPNPFTRGVTKQCLISDPKTDRLEFLDEFYFLCNLPN